METSRKSSLPLWLMKNLGANKLGIECPRKGCGGKAIVNKKKWLHSRTVENADGSKTDIIGRSCTYCFKTARIK